MLDTTLAQYRVIRKLGAGGMGEVYLAQDTVLDRHVALKVLKPEHTRDEDRLRRFRQEARAASALNHPNILTIYEVGESDGRHFIATEFVDGETLRDLLTRTGPMDMAAAVSVASQVASGLAAAHQAGIVHRDIKPENVMVRRDGYVKILDFGLAKLTERDAPQTDTIAPTATAIAHTAAGVVVGTAQYMSPEQAQGQPVGSRSDIFSFGAVLYEMTAGERPFQGESLMAVLAAIINQEPKRLPANVPADLAQIILRCLRKEPARRYQTMADLHVVLEDLRDASRASRRPRPLASQPWIAATLAGLAVIATVSAWRLWRTEPTSEPLEVHSLTTLSGVELFPSFAPDGNHVAFSWTGPRQDNQDVYVQQIGSGSPLRLTTDPLNDYNSVWSPDGRWIAFFRSQPPAPTGLRTRELRLIPPLGGPERKLADVRSQDFFPAAAYLAWTADSSALVVTDSPGDGKPDALFLVSVATGEKRQLTTPQSPIFADTSPAVSPDGRSLVFLRRTAWAAGELVVLSLGADLRPQGEPRRLTTADRGADFPAWTPDGRDIVFSAKRSLWRIGASGRDVPMRLPYVGEDGLMPAMSRTQNGETRLVYARSYTDWNVWRIETSAPGASSSSPPVIAISSTRPEYHPQFSPDGRRVVFSSFRSGDAEIWVSNPDGSDAVALTSLAAVDSNCPHWSPDGQLVTFSSTAADEFDIFVVPAAGGQIRRLTSHPAIDLCPSFSRDGQSIYFTSTRSGDYRIWRMPASGGDAVQVTPNQGTQAFDAADSDYLYYITPAIQSPVWRLPKSGGTPVEVLTGVVWFNFSLLEKGAYYIDQIAGAARLQYLDFATGASNTIATNLGEVGAGLTASGDGRTILYTKVDASVDDLMLVENFK